MHSQSSGLTKAFVQLTVTIQALVPDTNHGLPAAITEDMVVNDIRATDPVAHRLKRLQVIGLSNRPELVANGMFFQSTWLRHACTAEIEIWKILLNA